jgi:UMF1 family MFS transporter
MMEINLAREECVNSDDGDRAISGAAVSDRRGRFSWALFDWANQPFFTLITTFIFAPYFTSIVVGDATRGQELWGYGQGVAGLIIALASPVMGAMADATGPRKPWIAVFQVACVAACVALWWAEPAAEDAVLLWILLCIVIATVAAEFSIVFNNAMLPALVNREHLGRLSGYAWALGYLGGLVSLAVVLGGFSLTDTPLFGLDKSIHQHDRIVGPMTAIWIIVFVLPLFLFTPDTKASGLSYGDAVAKGLAQLRDTLRSLNKYRNLLTFLIARMLYQDGLSAIFAFGGIYAAGIFDWTTTDLGIFGIVLTIFAAIGAAAGGWLDDRIGSRATIIIAVGGLIVGTLGVISISVEGVGTAARVDTVLFFFQYQPGMVDGGMFTTLAEQIYLFFGIVIGMCGGPAQAASRAMVTRLAPPAMIGEFYGLFALSGKATAFAAPFAVAFITGIFVSQRVGISVILVFLVAGGLLMLLVREEDGSEL